MRLWLLLTRSRDAAGSASRSFEACKASALFTCSTRSLSRAPKCRQPAWEELLLKRQQTGSKRLCQGSCGGICSLSEQGYTLDSLGVAFLILGHVRKNPVPSWRRGRRSGEGSGRRRGKFALALLTSVLRFGKQHQPSPGGVRRPAGLSSGGRHPPRPSPLPETSPSLFLHARSTGLAREPGAGRGGMGQRRGPEPAEPLGPGCAYSTWPGLWGSPER